MVKPNQIINIYICRKSMQEHYINKGYENVLIGKRIDVKAEDLTLGSKMKIKYICDYCGKEFERQVVSNARSKKNNDNLKDACEICSRSLRFKETSKIRYGVENPMQLETVQKKCEQSKINKNFEGSNFNSCTGFVNGIPVSKAQFNLKEVFPVFELNYHYGKYYIDLFYNNICIEYDGKGHDLGVRLKKITEEVFLNKEKEKQNYLLKNFRLLRITDKKDKFKQYNNCLKYKNEILNFINSDEIYKELIIS